MLNQVIATRFIKRMSSGRTLPCLLECEDEEGNTVELVVKCSHQLMEKEKNLAFEAIAAMLAADLGLPVPEPFIVLLEPEFVELVTDSTIKGGMQKSCQYAFGSRLVTGYAAWQKHQMISKEQTQQAAEIVVFDQIVINSDRRPENVNCLFLADGLFVFDHELVFTKELFWRAPWEDGGLKDIESRERHIFAGPYYESPPIELDRFVAAWEQIRPDRLQAYLRALPTEWVYDENHLQDILSYLSQVKTNIRVITDNALKGLR